MGIERKHHTGNRVASALEFITEVQKPVYKNQIYKIIYANLEDLTICESLEEELLLIRSW